MNRIFLATGLLLISVLLLPTCLLGMARAWDFSKWQPLPEKAKPVAISTEKTTIQHENSMPSQTGGWSFLISPDDSTDVELKSTLVLDSAAKQFEYFGSSWSVWPDPRVADKGFEAAILFRANQDGSSGYRVQFSSRYQEVALVRFPDGGYVRSVPCTIKTQTPINVRVTMSGETLRIFVDDRMLIHYVDRLTPFLAKGRVGVGASSLSRVSFSDFSINPIKGETPQPQKAHQPQLRTRKWIGDRTWVFDADEPILLLPSAESSTIMNVKLLPGFKPLLTWNSHWDTQNQGAYAEATNNTVDVKTSGGGEKLLASWVGKHTRGRFGTKSGMTVGFDSVRGTYTYDVESELEVFKGEPFHFRYGYDFEHHTPLDPFNWQYLIAKRRGGDFYHRPVCPVDPGPQYDIEMYHGQRVWYGRHNADMKIAPAVEYEISPEWNPVKGKDGTPTARLCNTAVCAAFYDTGVAFVPETANPGTKIRVKYRYTGYPADEAKNLFEQSRVYSSPTLDPNHHYIFADDWPKLSFSKFVPMSQTWQLGRFPFMTGHNQRPTYELVKNCGAGSGFAMKLGPASYGKTNLPTGGPITKGRYALTALVKSENTLGEGGRMELEALQGKTSRKIASARHFVGTGTFEWKKQGFLFEVPENADALSIAFGNNGTGDFLVTDVEFKKLGDDAPLPNGLLEKANDIPASPSKAPKGAVADYRMLEGRGYHALNYAGGPHLELANLSWVVDEGRPALKFAETNSNREDFNPSGYIGMHIFGNAQDFNYLASYKAYENARKVPFAMGAGGAIVLGCERFYLHGAYYRGLIGRTVVLNRALSGKELSLLSRDEPLNDLETDNSKGITLAAWIKPAPKLANNTHPGGGDIIGYGNRRYILKLQGSGDRGENAPYRLSARLNVNDGIASEPTLDANRWHHVALTAVPENGQRRMRLYLNGTQISEGLTLKWSE